MNGRRVYLPLLALGFFSLASQALLFRDVVAAFGYSEPGTAVFYATWLFWIAVGAWAGRTTGPLPINRRPGLHPSSSCMFQPLSCSTF